MKYILLIIIIHYTINIYSFINLHKLSTKSNKWNIIDDNNRKIILKKSNTIYNNTNATLFIDEFNNYKKILISPGGLNGLYMLGISHYIIKHYELNKCIFSGASAGAWIALILSYNNDDIDDFIYNILHNSDILNNKSLKQIQKSLKTHLLNNYKSNNFNLNKLFIGVTQYDTLDFYTNIYSDFIDLEDAIDCCIASSQIPLITNDLIIEYNNKISLDGGFSKHPYIPYNNKPYIITPDIWNNKPYSMFDIHNSNILELYKKGYSDSIINIDDLNEFFNLYM